MTAEKIATTAKEYHRDCIRQITERAKREMRPHIDELARIERLKPIPILVRAILENDNAK